jgi:Acetyltransferase (isoleucine patch superfamily)
VKRQVKHIGAELLVLFAKYWRKMDARLDRAMGTAAVRELPNKGRSCSIEGNGRIIDPHLLFLGDHVFIGRNHFIRATGGVHIGSYTHISRNVTLHTANHNTNGDVLPYDHSLVTKPIHIGNYVWIGMNCSILPGVTIGDGAIIGMGTVVSKSVAPGEIVVGAAQRVVGRRDPARTEELARLGKFLEIRRD